MRYITKEDKVVTAITVLSLIVLAGMAILPAVAQENLTYYCAKKAGNSWNVYDTLALGCGGMSILYASLGTPVGIAVAIAFFG